MPVIRPLLLLISPIAFGLGISLPLVRFEKFYFFSETPSLIEIVAGLWAQSDFGLALIVGVFSIVFPIIKLYTVFAVAYASARLPGWTSALARWSMMDVLLVAILVFAAKTSGLASAVSQPGIWFYALSTVSAAMAAAGYNTHSAAEPERR